MSTDRKVAVVTGGARGIGAATARQFARSNYAVAVLDVLDEGQTLCDELNAAGADALFFHCDVSSEAEVKEQVVQIQARYGRIDVLVNNAGVVLVKQLEEVAWEEYQKVINTNLGGTFLLCKYVLPIMKRQGSGAIVNMASVSGHVGQIDHALYGATKGAILAFTRALAWEVAPYHIRVNSVSPGSVDTPMLRGDIAIESQRTGLAFDQVKIEREGEQAFKRWADPAEIATAIYFLAGEGASFITGTDLLVDCGWVAR
jgi:NAD(P)-dependent dehydrogenase (short-subunit alcohol dehydrogenase family)